MAASTPNMDFAVIVGSYEQIIMGYELKNKEENEDLILKQFFSDHSHTGYIKTIAATDMYLASGSTDETIKLYDLQENKEIGSLLQHDGSVTCLCFHGNSHLLSGSGDGSICIWSTASWDCLQIMKGHKGPVNSLCVHPSGKLAMTVGQDQTLRTWNLITGRLAHVTKLKQVAEMVKWSPCGKYYVLVTANRADVYQLATAEKECSINTSFRIYTVTFIQGDVLAVGGESENISFYQIGDKKKCLCQFQAHKKRVKSMLCVNTQSSDEMESKEKLLFSISNDGFVKIWKIDLNKIKETPKLVTELNTGARLICLAVVQLTNLSIKGEGTLEKPKSAAVAKNPGFHGKPIKKRKKGKKDANELAKKRRK